MKRGRVSIPGFLAAVDQTPVFPLVVRDGRRVQDQVFGIARLSERLHALHLASLELGLECRAQERAELVRGRAE